MDSLRPSYEHRPRDHSNALVRAVQRLEVGYTSKESLFVHGALLEVN
eukprot:SAG31_NODE_39204_length_290_cov_0.811518_1_plen_46_part_10